MSNIYNNNFNYDVSDQEIQNFLNELYTDEFATELPETQIAT